MPMLYPTVVVGVGDTLGECIRGLQSLLDTYATELMPIMRVGIVTNEGVLTDAHGRLVLPQRAPSTEAILQEPLEGGDPLAQALAEWLESVITERHLEAVRAKGILVGSPMGHLFVRVALVLDSSVSPELSERVLRAFQAAAETLRSPLPLRMTCVALTAGSNQAELGFPLQKWLQRYRSDHLEPNLTIVLDRWRSDGSCLDNEEVRGVLAFLLFLALLPTQAQEHWFFPSPARRRRPQTFGIGAVVIPLPDIERTLRYVLMADLLALMPAPPDPHAEPTQFLRPFQLHDTFSERTVWQSLFRGVPVDLSATDARPFSVRLPHEAVKLELDGLPWQEWAERLADYNHKWGKVLAEEWLNQMRQNMHQQKAHLLQSIRQVLDATVREGKGMLTLAEEAIKQIRTILRDEWRCTGAKAQIGVPDPDLTTARKALEEAIHQMPSAPAIGARCFLLGLVPTYLVFALARGVWGQYGWSPPIVVGLGIVLLLILWGSLWLHGVKLEHDAYQHVLDARSAYIRAIAEKYEAVLASEGILLLCEIQEYLLSQLESEEIRLRNLREQIDTTVKQARALAQNFAPSTSSLLRPVIEDWQGLELIARDLWGNRELKPFLQSMLEQAEITTYEELCTAAHTISSAGEAVSTPQGSSSVQVEVSALFTQCAVPAMVLLQNRLSVGQLRSLSYYLCKRFRSREEYEEWVSQQVKQNYQQATKLFWATLGEGKRIWQLLPLHEDRIAELAVKLHPEPVPPSEHLHVVGVLGTLCQQEIRFPKEERGAYE